MGRWFPIAKRGLAMNLKATTLTYLAIVPSPLTKGLE